MSKTMDATQLTSAQDRLAAYAKIALTVDATAKAFNGEAVSAEQFTAATKDTLVLQGNKTDLWSILNVALNEATKEDTKLFQDKDVESLAVSVDGKVLQVTISKVEGLPNEFDIGVAKYTIEAGEVVSNPINLEDIRISRQEGIISAKMPGTDVVVTQTQFLDRPHQVDAVLASVGLEMQDKGVIAPTSREVKTAQLITAGTGSGKSGILASLALGYGAGIIAVPNNLLKDAMDDTPNFLGAKVTQIDDKSTQADLDKALSESKYIVMSHGALAKFADKIAGKNVLLDEVHEVSSATLDALKTNNNVLGTTATPSPETYASLGESIYDLSVHKAQHELHTVRPVLAQDTETSKDKIVEETLVRTLARSGIIHKGMTGYDARNSTVLSSEVRGMIFADDPAVAKALHESLSHLDTKHSLQHTINVAAREDRRTTQAVAREHGEATSGKLKDTGIDVAAELRASRAKSIEDSMKVDLIVTSMLVENPKLTPDKLASAEKKLRRTLRTTGSIDAEYQKTLPSITKNKDIIRETLHQKEQGTLSQYYSAAINYLDGDKSSVQRVSQHYGASVLLQASSKPQEIEDAKQLVAKGVSPFIISDKALGTGYSNQDILNTVTVQTRPIQTGKAAERMQQAGRPIRDTDGFAFVSSVVDTKIPKSLRNMTTEEVFSKDALRAYNRNMATESKADQLVALRDTLLDQHMLHDVHDIRKRDAVTAKVVETLGADMSDDSKRILKAETQEILSHLDTDSKSKSAIEARTQALIEKLKKTTDTLTRKPTVVKTPKGKELGR